MIKYEEAKKIADGINSATNSVTEFNDAYVFSNKNSKGFGGNSEPVAVLKKTGKAVPFWAYIDDGSHKQIAEYPKK